MKYITAQLCATML